MIKRNMKVTRKVVYRAYGPIIKDNISFAIVKHMKFTFGRPGMNHQNL